MNRYLVTTLVAIAAAAVTTVASADDIGADTTPFVSTKSRAEVQGQLQLQRGANANPYATNYDQVADFRSSRTRAEVTADYLAARDEVEAMTSEDGGSGFLSQRDAGNGGSVFAGEAANGQ